MQDVLYLVVKSEKKSIRIKRFLQGRHNVYCSPYKGIKDTHCTSKKKHKNKKLKKRQSENINIKFLCCVVCCVFFLASVAYKMRCVSYIGYIG